MSTKRPKGDEYWNLRAVIDDQLTAAAHEIFLLLQERVQTDVEQLRELVTERITAAVEFIFTVFEASRAGDEAAEEPGESPAADPEPTTEVPVQPVNNQWRDVTYTYKFCSLSYCKDHVDEQLT